LIKNLQTILSINFSRLKKSARSLQGRLPKGMHPPPIFHPYPLFIPQKGIKGDGMRGIGMHPLGDGMHPFPFIPFYPSKFGELNLLKKKAEIVAYVKIRRYKQIS
jgi:hypothetical protein